MNLNDLLNALETALKENFASKGMALSVAGTEEDALELLSLPPSGARAVLMAGDIDLPDDASIQAAGVADMTVRLVLQVPKGMALKPSEAVKGARPLAALNLLQLCREARGYLSRCIAPARADFDNESGFRFTGERPYMPGGLPGLRARELTFRLTAGLDMSDCEPDAAIDLFPT